MRYSMYPFNSVHFFNKSFVFMGRNKIRRVRATWYKYLDSVNLISGRAGSSVKVRRRHNAGPDSGNSARKGVHAGGPVPLGGKVENVGNAKLCISAVMRIPVRRIRMLLGLLDPDPDPLVRGWIFPSSNKNSKNTWIPTVLWLLFDFLSLKNDVQ